MKSRNSLLKALAAVMAASMILTVAGCGGGGNSSTAGSSTSSKTESSAAESTDGGDASSEVTGSSGPDDTTEHYEFDAYYSYQGSVKPWGLSLIHIYWDHYKDGMFVLGDEEKDKEVFALRPMTCPFQYQVYLNRARSYRDLPMRLGETSTCLLYTSQRYLCAFSSEHSQQFAVAASQTDEGYLFIF